MERRRKEWGEKNTREEAGEYIEEKKGEERGGKEKGKEGGGVGGGAST